MSVDLRKKAIGAMIGSALGDAIGELAFRYRRRDALIQAVDREPMLCYTDDTAMAGAISGAYLGIDAIPSAWVSKLENRPYIEQLALKLLY